MKGRNPTLLLAFALGLSLLLVTAATAKKIPDIEILSAAKGHWTVCPAGDGPRLDELGLTVTLQLSSQGYPLDRYPWQDLWIVGCTPQAPTSCGWVGLNADAASDEDGIMTLSGAWDAGGHSQDGLVIYASGIAMNEVDPPVPALHIRVNSPDINGDGIVNLGDVGLFAADVVQYDFRSDFVANGTVDLADLAVLVEHIGHRCSSGSR